MTVVVPAIAVADPHCGVDELALLAVIAHHGDAGATSLELTDRLSWSRDRLRASRKILHELGYVDIEPRGRGELVFRIRTPCGPSTDESTPACADDVVHVTSADDAISDDVNHVRSPRDVPDPSTPGVEQKPGTTSADDLRPQNPQGSTTSKQNPPTPHAVVPPAEDVHDEEAPPGAAAPDGTRTSSIVAEAIGLLADQELDRMYVSGRRVNNRDQLRGHIIVRLEFEHGHALDRLARTVHASSGAELLAARHRCRQIEAARELGRTWARLQNDVDVAALTANQFRHDVDPVAATAACLDAYRAERPAGRRDWRDRAATFGSSLAAARRGFTASEVEQRAVQRFGFDDELTEITLAAWRAADTRKASA